MHANRRPRFAVIGTGNMAATMMNTFKRVGINVAAIVSRDAARAREFASAFHVTTAGEDIEAVLKSEEFDAVYVANDGARHASTTIAALELGKAVLCEKPLAHSADEAERVADVARRTGNVCMEGIWIRFLPAYRRFIELARTKACGHPSHLYADFGYPVGENMLPRFLSPRTGGVLLDRGIYLLALALDVFGPVGSVEAALEINSEGVDRDAYLQLSHLGGEQSQLAISFTSLMSNTATLACAEGLIRLEEPLIGGETISTRRAAIARDPAQLLGLRQKFARSLRERAVLRRLKRRMSNSGREYLSYGVDPYVPQLRHFLGLLGAGSRESDIVPLELSLRIQRIIDQARVSAGDARKRLE
jgi:predicted dehydrogenase